MVAAAIVGAGVVGAVGSTIAGSTEASGAQNAAQTEADAATQNQNAVLAAGQQASSMDLGAIGAANAPLQPYVNLGNTASGTLSNLLTGQNSGQMLQALGQMPGYQFELQQGLEATQNGFAARGLGSSGAAMKGAANYANGLAASNYENFYNNALADAQLGASAAGTQSQNIGNLTTAGANALVGGATNAASLGMAGASASAAGQVGAANAIGGSISNASNMLGQSLSALSMKNLLTQPTQTSSPYLLNGAGGMYGVTTSPGLSLDSSMLYAMPN